MNKTLLLPLILFFAFVSGGCERNVPPPPTESGWIWNGVDDMLISVEPDYTIVSFEDTPPSELTLLADRPVKAWLWNDKWVDLGSVSGEPLAIDGSASSYLAMQSSDDRPVNVALQTAQPELLTLPIQTLLDIETLGLTAKGDEAQSVLDELLEWLPLELEESVFLAELGEPIGDDNTPTIINADGLTLRSITRSPKQGDSTCIDALPMYRAPQHQWHRSGDGFCGHISTVRSLWDLQIGGRTHWVDADDSNMLNPDAIRDIENKEGKERDTDGNVITDQNGNPVNKKGMLDADIVDAHIRLAEAKGATHEETKIQPATDINVEGEAGSTLELLLLDLKEILADESKDWDCTLTMSGTDAAGKDFAHAEHVDQVVQPTKEVTNTSIDDDGNTVTTPQTVPDGNEGHITTVDTTYQGTGAIGEGIPAVPRPDTSTSYDNWADKNQFNIDHGPTKSVEWKGKPGWTIKKLGYVCVAFKKQ